MSLPLYSQWEMTALHRDGREMTAFRQHAGTAEGNASIQRQHTGTAEGNASTQRQHTGTAEGNASTQREWEMTALHTDGREMPAFRQTTHTERRKR